MRIARIQAAAGARVAVMVPTAEGPRWVALVDAARTVLGSSCPDSMRLLLAQEGPGLSTARQVLDALDGAPVPAGVLAWDPAGARYALPVDDPGSFLDFYAYEAHVRTARMRRGLEMPPEWFDTPTYYRGNHRSLLPPGAEVVFPAGETKMDYELEVAAVLGAPIASPTPAQAEAAIAGFCLCNDWSARALQARVMKLGMGPARGKDFGTALGPWLVTPDEVPDWGAVELAVRVSGETWSQGTAAGMHWSWGELLAVAAAGTRYEPGDVFGSGTIGGGCGLELDRFLSPGDAVELDGGPLFGVLRGVARRREA